MERLRDFKYKVALYENPETPVEIGSPLDLLFSFFVFLMDFMA